MARITVLVQGYDATANLVAAALSLRPELPADVSTDNLLAQAAYRRPPVPALRRVALAPARLGTGPSGRATRWPARWPRPAGRTGPPRRR